MKTAVKTVGAIALYASAWWAFPMVTLGVHFFSFTAWMAWMAWDSNKTPSCAQPVRIPRQYDWTDEQLREFREWIERVEADAPGWKQGSR